VPAYQKLQMTAYPVLHRMLYSCTHMAIVGPLAQRAKVTDAYTLLCDFMVDFGEVTKVQQINFVHATDNT